MYEAFFGLNSPPFSAVPQAERYVPTTALEDARADLARCLQRGAGAGLVIGPPGTGKSLLLAVLAETVRGEYRVARIEGGRLSTRRALLQSILFELGQPFRDLDEGELRLALIDYLTSHPGCPQGAVLLVDEAQVLPLRLLEEIRLLSNLARGGTPRVRVALAGTAVLEERFATARLELFSQRLAARCYLGPLNRQETERYVRGRLELAGGEVQRIFAPEALESLYHATDGVPRLINQVCDHALLLACVSGQPTVDAATLEEAWADLQQLPAPWVRERDEAGASDRVIEFGHLDDPVGEPQSLPFRLAGDEPSPTESAAAAEADEGFQPAGAIGPEVELVLETAPDPFREPFAEEELIIDRCARLQAESLRQLQAISGDWTVTRPGAGRGLALDLAGPAARLEPEGAATHLAASVSAAAADPVLPTDPLESRLRQLLAEHERKIEAARGEGAEAAADEELIVVEDTGTIPLPATTPRATPVRQNQFGQLFARLRHG